jgi:hypothetical protein
VTTVAARSRAALLIDHLFALQADDGSFPGTIQMPTGRRVPDRNCFVTALVLRALSRATLPPERGSAVERALDFLVRSGSSERPGAWGFWPRGEGLRPDWIPEPPLDCDDTAIVALELVRWGRTPPPDAIELAIRVLLPQRLGAVDWPAPPWFGEGVFVTWMEDDGRPQVIDCAVNANVAALFAYLGLKRLPGYLEACGLIERALAWAGGSAIRARTLAPFYPAPCELVGAIEHAVACGADELGRALEQARRAPWAAAVPDAPLCSSMYGACRWTSDAVAIARRVAAADALG